MIRIILSLAFLLPLITSGSAFDNGQYKDVDPYIRNWFKSLKSPHGVPCCDTSDGHFTIWRQSEKQGYEFEAFIEDQWIPIPPDTVIRNNNNPTGQPIVWYIKLADRTYHIRCFILGPDA